MCCETGKTEGERTVSASLQSNGSGKYVPVSAFDDLTLKQRKFVEAYCFVTNGNATEAARLAGYDASEESLRVIGCDNLTKINIREAINEQLDSVSMLPGEILREFSDVGRAPWREFVQVQLNDEGETVSARLALGDKLRALENLAKIRRMHEPPPSGANTDTFEAVRAAVTAFAEQLGLAYQDALNRLLERSAGTQAEAGLRQLAAAKEVE